MPKRNYTCSPECQQVHRHCQSCSRLIGGTHSTSVTTNWCKDCWLHARTCRSCGRVGEYPVWGHQCARCRYRKAKR